MKSTTMIQSALVVVATFNLLHSTETQARELSQYPDFFESNYLDHALLEAGLDVHHIFENHPAVSANHPDAVADLRVAMQGLDPKTSALDSSRVQPDEEKQESLPKDPPAVPPPPATNPAPKGLRSGTTPAIQPNVPLPKKQPVPKKAPPPANTKTANSPPATTTPLQFDFVVGGFPKCGTTTLLKSFGAHAETDMVPNEVCAIAAPAQADLMVLKKLDLVLKDLQPNLKRAFKCPTVMYNYRSIVRLEKHSPRAKFVVGIRHPVKMMQSFYNYRVTELYERKIQEEIPDFLDLIASNEPWKGVSLHSVRFELFLQQLGKTPVSPQDLDQLASMTDFGYELAIKPSNFTVFLYTVDQLEDTNTTRTDILRHQLQDYLGLSTPIAPFGHENKNHAVGDSAHPESIRICDPQYQAVRETLVRNGIRTAAWIRDHLLASPDIVVANPEHFVATLDDWAEDPCTVVE